VRLFFPVERKKKLRATKDVYWKDKRKKQMVTTGPRKAKLLHKSLNDKGGNFPVF